MNPETYKFGWRNMPAESVAGAYPFIYSGLNDGDGVLLGKDSTGGIVLLDIWKRGGDRTNSNLTILGKPGTGKSTTIKKWLKEEFGRGCKIIILDPEDEYSGLAEGCDGAVIDVGNGSVSRINPLQVRGKVPLDEDDEDSKDRLYTQDEVDRGPLALHFNFLRTFFKLYLKESKDDRDYNQKHAACLEMALIEMYNKHNIDWDTDPNTIKNEDWPHMQHLYAIIQEKAKQEKYKQYWEDLELLLYSAAMGADRHLWCGPTTLKPKDELIVLNLQQILEADERVKRTQFFNMLSWAWNEIDEDWEEKVILAVDEAYLLADPDTPQALQFLRNTSKRIRKREGGLWVITHNMVDFMDPAIRRFGQALLDNPAYKFIMGQGENDIAELSKLMALSDKERATIAEAKRGQGLLLAGSKRLAVKIQITKEDEQFIGTAGGR
jgi:DNA helicase HerA-like ATPase